MPIIATCSSHWKYALAKKMIDLSVDIVKVLLMRQGFSFNPNNHATLKNIKNTVVINATTNTITVSNTTNTFTRTSGSWLTDGFVVGNKITTTNFINAANNGTWLISALTATVMTITTTAGTDPVLTDETNTTVVNLTWVSNDELATGFGYTQDTMTTGIITVTEDNINNRMDATFPTITWTASTGSIGPTPGAILYDDTSADDTIIGYIDFGGDQTALDTNTFNITNGIIRIA